MVAHEDNRHRWLVYVLCGLAMLAVGAAVIIPGVQWILRPANYIPAVVALSLLGYWRVYRGWGQVLIWLALMGLTLHQIIK